MNIMNKVSGRRAVDDSAARGIGVTSLLIGLSELVFPQQLEKAMGIGNGRNTGILRAMGVREVMHGIDLLSHKDPTSGMWARVAGDALDTALLAGAARRTKKPLAFAAIATTVMAIGFLDFFFANRLSND